MRGRQAVSERSVQEEYLLGGKSKDKVRKGTEEKSKSVQVQKRRRQSGLPNQQVQNRKQAPIRRAEKRRNRQAAGGNHLPASQGRINPDE